MQSSIRRGGVATIESLHWEEQTVPSGRFAYVAKGLGGTVYYIVWEEPCWCVRQETPGVGPRWMGQFVEPGGLDLAKQKAQAHYTLIQRKKAWDKFFEENDPPFHTALREMEK